MSNRRPEHTGPPELYYDETESSKYASNSHIVQVQTDLTERAIELLALPDSKVCYLLDLGCGSGISGEVISNHGHVWVGLDVSLPMLKINREDDEDPTKDLILRDMGSGMPFRPGTFDGAVSISAIQWLCHANSADQNPKKRLHRFFQSLYGCMGRGTRAVFQFYPENEQQSDLIMSQAMRAGFNGGLVVDFPNSAKAKKVYLVLMTGGVQQLPRALTEEGADQDVRRQVENVGRRVFQTGRPSGKDRLVKGSKAWIDAKRERAGKRGREVAHESKYSGRKRKTKW